jgi:hypothetical protein
MGCEYNSVVKSKTISRQETIYHSIVDLYISEFTSRASVPPISCFVTVIASGGSDVAEVTSDILYGLAMKNKDLFFKSSGIIV